ncbi:MAG: Bax inhibitor-1/YccA family protein [Candidatus Pacebacteria bacterium]|nr:Bax inhibitor-1/YccA family protein [Candidatus Paceibacterota bacterium]
MANGWQTPVYGQKTYDRTAYDAGLRRYMQNIFNTMGAGLALSGLVAYFVGLMIDRDSSFYNPAFAAIMFSPFIWVMVIAQIGLVIFLAARINKMSLGAAQASFWLYAGMTGLVFSTLFAVYTKGSLAQVFFVTAATFGVTSLYGYVTKRDLSKLGPLLIMGAIGIMIASIVNIFLKSPALMFVYSAIGVLVFTGLTAYDTQRLKEAYDSSYDRSSMGKMVIMGALSLYLDFINLFIMLLNLMGERK